MPSNYTPDQSYQRYSLLSSEIKFSANGAFLITPNMGWIKLGSTRWLWLLDGIHYVEDDRTLTRGFSVEGPVPVPALGSDDVVVSRTALVRLRDQIGAMLED